jgi:hypothetical protein
MSDKSYKIIDNVLEKNTFLELKNVFEDERFPWHFVKNLNEFVKETDLSCYFINMIYRDREKEGVNDFQVSHFFKVMFPLLNIIQPKQLIRIKANLYPRTQNIEYHPQHTDYDFPHNGAMFYINSNDGKTVINNGEVEIESIANRLVIFNSALPHNSTSTTNQKARINLNINYI